MKANIMLKVALLVAVCFASVIPAKAIIGFQNPAGSYGNQGAGGNANSYVLGLEFTVGALPLTVTSLGAFDNGQNGFLSPISVAIYNSSWVMMGGQSVTFGPGNQGTLGADGGSFFLPITPFTLTAGQAYTVVAAGYGGGAGVEWNYDRLVGTSTPPEPLNQASAISPNNSYSWIGSSLSVVGTPDGLTGFSFGGVQWGGPTFDFAPVPEASYFAMAGIGLLGVIYVGRCTLQRRRAV